MSVRCCFNMPLGKPVKRNFKRRKLRSHLTTKPCKGVVEVKEGGNRGGYKPWWPLPEHKFLGVSFLMFLWVVKPLTLFPFSAQSDAYSPPLPYLLRQLIVCKLVCWAWWSVLGWSCLAILLPGCLGRYLPEQIIPVVTSYFTRSYFSPLFLSHKDNMGKKNYQFITKLGFWQPCCFPCFPLNW